MTVTVRPITEAERPEFRRLLGLAFGFDLADEELESFNEILETERTVCTFDGEQMVGTAGAFSLEMTVPGGVLPVAGTTMVSVLATHRRQSVLRRMMRAHFDEVRKRGDVLAALWASESSIYGRFGYGPAASLVDAEIDRRHAGLSGPPRGSGTVRLVDVDEAKQLLPTVFEQTRRVRPGMFRRSASWWEHRVFHDPESQRRDATRYRYAIYEENGIARGYVQYRAEEQWDANGLPNGEVRIFDLQAVDLSAADSLWRYVSSIDLIRRINYWNLPADDPLLWLLNDPRRLSRRVSDSLWVALIDIPAALAARRYCREGRLVIEVRDEFDGQNSGRYVLDTTGESAVCSRDTSAPDLSMAASDLGAIYMGGVRLLDLVAAGRAQGSPGALRRADAMFSWHPAPWCQEIF